MTPFEQWTAELQSSKSTTPKLWLPSSLSGYGLDTPTCPRVAFQHHS